MANLGIPGNTISILQKYGFNFRKKFGQNFLIDTHVLEKIMDAAEVTKDDFVLEIGPGIGTMTQYLCERAREVAAVEIDGSLIPILHETLSGYGNVEVIHEDVLKLDLKQLAIEKNGGRPIKVVAKLRLQLLWVYSKAMCRRSGSRSWCRRKSRSGCRRGLGQKHMARFRWPYSIMRSRASSRMCR